MRSRVWAWTSLVIGMALTTPAFSQTHELTSEPDVAAILTAATPEARAVFEQRANGVVHRPSGLICGGLIGGAALSRVAWDGEGAACTYVDQAGVVAQIIISREAAERPVLRAADCSEAPKRMKLRMGPGILPGVSRTVGPIQPKTMTTLPVAGQPVPLWRCAVLREPFNNPIIVIDVAALRTPDGWTARAMHFPRPPPCCQSYRGGEPILFFLHPLLMMIKAVDAPPEAVPKTPMEIISLTLALENWR